MAAGAPNFSPSLTLAGMDYIAPSAACIKPTLINQKNTNANNNSNGNKGGGVVGLSRGGNAVGAAAAPHHPDVVKITLQDCLACSGCVTTAETVLVNAQSRTEIIATLLGTSTLASDLAATAGQQQQSTLPSSLAEPSLRPRLVSISPQSCASLAAYLGLTMADTYALIAGFVRTVLTPAGLQVEAARAAEAEADTLASAPASASAAPLLPGKAAETRVERDERDEEASPADAKDCLHHPDATTTAPTTTTTTANTGTTAVPSIYVIDLEWAEQLSAALTAQEYSRRRTDEPTTLPMIVSACPGWVCYCEKQGSALLPHLCPVMSAQGIAGSYAKRTVSRELYHISIQPCFDRKLEAARDAMPATRVLDSATDTAASGGEGDADVDVATEAQLFYTDCVLSTAELLEWMKAVDPSLPWREPLDSRAQTSELAAVTPAPGQQEENCDVEDEENEMSKSKEEGGPGCNSGMAAASSLEVITAAAHDAARLAGSGGYHQSVIADRLRRQTGTTAADPTLSIGGASAVIELGEPASRSSALAAASPSIHYEIKRNHNHQLATCAQLPGEVFCVGYGFQQIQNVVRGLKKRMPAMRSYTFVELMACPDGCLNGGGQVRPAQQPHSEVLDAVIAAYARHAGLAAHKVEEGGCAAVRRNAETPLTQTSEQNVEDAEAAKKYNNAEEDECHGENALQRRRLDLTAPPSSRQIAGAVMPQQSPFATSTIAAVAPQLGDKLWRCTFRDREKEFAEMLNAGNIHSLKW